MKITVVDSGFVTYDSLNPVGYAGEMNSRKLEISHPHFKDCYYQILVKRFDGLYTLGVTDGIAEIPPSLLRSPADLECQFVAMSTPDSVNNSETDTFVFKSNAFTLEVAQGLNIGNMSPIPTYEELQKMYNNIDNAKAEVDKAKEDNEAILQAIQKALDSAHKVPVVDLEENFRKGYKAQLDAISSEHFQQFSEDITSEVIKRLEDDNLLSKCDCSDVGKMTTEQLTQYIKQIHSQLVNEAKSGTATWLRNQNFDAYTMSPKGDIIGGR